MTRLAVLPLSLCVVFAGAFSGCATPKPVVAPVAGLYQCPLSVTITDKRAGGEIFYTTDGSAPGSSSTRYAGPFAVNQPETVQAVAIAPGAKTSAPTKNVYGCALSRKQFAVALQKQYSLAPPSGGRKIPDVGPDDPAYSAIQATYTYIYAPALCPICYIDPRFFPNEPIYREIAAVTFVQLLQAQGKIQLLGDAETAAVLGRVADASHLPAPAKPYIATAIKYEILRLGAGNTIQRDSLQTQDDLATTFSRIQKQFNFPPVGVVGVPR